jgi:hypothetical protein
MVLPAAKPAGMMAMRVFLGFLRRPAIACAAALTLLTLFPIAFGRSATTVLAQRVSVSSEFRVALEPYGEFRRHPRWGEVWVPAHVARDWRPYTVGGWVYTNDYGWYWNAADEEASWGWIVYHYGRWVWEDVSRRGSCNKGCYFMSFFSESNTGFADTFTEWRIDLAKSC